MQVHRIDESLIREYVMWMKQSEKSEGTVRKYQYYLTQFCHFLEDAGVCKERVIQWKDWLKKGMSPATVNGALAAVNGLFRYKGWNECVVKFLKVGRQVFRPDEKELTVEEYRRMVLAAKEAGNERLSLLIQTVCATGIRISELSYITVEAAEQKAARVDCKGKIRTVLLPKGLCRMLREYAERKRIEKGMIFVTRTGRKLDRSNIWREMKKAAKLAQISLEKAFPHNLRHLFARSFYRQEKDLLRLADILGHSNVNTTRIYTMESGGDHIRRLEKMELLVEEYNSMYENNSNDYNRMLLSL
ncbi:tyrosine-type recombinase/integrase [Lachnospiraceae bacterium 62-35]